MLDAELTGRDWIAMAPPAHRAIRLRNLSAVARGAVLVTHRRAAMVAGDDCSNEEIALPFAPEDSGVHPIMVHVDWRLDHLTKMTAITQIEHEALDFKIVPLQ
jgi:hypothetical protein